MLRLHIPVLNFKSGVITVPWTTQKDVSIFNAIRFKGEKRIKFSSLHYKHSHRFEFYHLFAIFLFPILIQELSLSLGQHRKMFRFLMQLNWREENKVLRIKKYTIISSSLRYKHSHRFEFYHPFAIFVFPILIQELSLSLGQHRKMFRFLMQLNWREENKVFIPLLQTFASNSIIPSLYSCSQF